MNALSNTVNSTLQGVGDIFGMVPLIPDDFATQQQMLGQFLGNMQPQLPTGVMGGNPNVQPAPPGSTSARNLANFNFGNVKTINGGYEQYASREDGLMGVGERVLRYNNAPDRGWHAQTLRQMVDIYAPASDKNNPAEYAAFLGRRLGVNPNAPVNFRDPRILAGLIQSMPIMEHGAGRVNISYDEALAAANRLLQGARPQKMSAASRAQNIVQNSWRYR